MVDAECCKINKKWLEITQLPLFSCLQEVNLNWTCGDILDERPLMQH